MSASRLKHPNTETLPIGQYLKSRSKYNHVSCKVAMHANPAGALLPAIPWIQKPGKTYRKVKP